jgi:hypothetical protein
VPDGVTFTDVEVYIAESGPSELPEAQWAYQLLDDILCIFHPFNFSVMTTLNWLKFSFL